VPANALVGRYANISPAPLPWLREASYSFSPGDVVYLGRSPQGTDVLRGLAARGRSIELQLVADYDGGRLKACESHVVRSLNRSRLRF
jgi:hypothetical protein